MATKKPAPKSTTEKPATVKKGLDEKFRDSATIRVNKALRSMSSIGDLSNKARYEYTDEQAQKVIAALEEGLNKVKARFSSDAPAEEGFTL